MNINDVASCRNVLRASNVWTGGPSAGRDVDGQAACVVLAPEAFAMLTDGSLP